MESLLSVIIPVYNSEKYLKKCLESVIKQTYEKLQIILIDDGSTDLSGEICDSYKIIDRRIEVVHKKNGGVSECRNYGLDISKGQYIAFLDSDDWIEETLYEELFRLLKIYEADISVCNFKQVYNEEEKLINSNNEEVYSNIEALEQCNTSRNPQLISVVWNKIYKRELFEQIRFPVGRIHEDEFINPQLIYSAKKVAYTEKQLIYYRKTPNSIMNKEFNIKRLDYLYMLNNRNKFFLENHLYELYKKGLMRELDVDIEYYNKVYSSNIVDKKKIFKEIISNVWILKKKVNQQLDNKSKLRINLFLLSPRLYCKLINFKIKR